MPSVCSSSSSSTQRALCLLHVELDSGWRILWMHVYGGCMCMVYGYPCRIGAEESCRTSSCRIAVSGSLCEDCSATASNGAFLK